MVDTWVLDEATKTDSPHMLAAIGLLALIQDRDHVAFDSGGVVMRQYQDCIARCQRQSVRIPPEFLQQWIAQLMAKGAAVWYDGSVPSRHWKAMLALPNSFDDDDEVFVGVAFRAADHLLVSEDGDYDEHVKGYLQEHMEIRVMTLAEAREEVAG